MAELNQAAVERLKGIMSSEGPAALDNPTRLRGLISDHLSGFKRERQALTAALSAGVPQRLLSRRAEMIDGSFRRELSTELQRRESLDMATADWAVGGWAVALGLSETIPSGLPVPADGGARQWYRQPRRVGLIAGAGVVGLFLALYLVGLAAGDPETPSPSPSSTEAGPTPTPTSTPTSTPTPTPTPTPTSTPTSTPTPTSNTTPTFEARPLLEWIPADVRASCVPVNLNENYGAYVEGYACQAEGVDGLWYASYENLDALESAYYDGFGMRPYEDTGNCPTETPSDRTWNFQATPDISRGRLACYVGADGLAHVNWTMDYARVLGTMQHAGEVAYLYEQWTQVGVLGPTE